MSELDEQLRDFVRRGAVPVPHVPDLLERVAAGQRRHRRRQVAGLAAAACVVAGLGVAGVVLRPAGHDRVPNPAASPACGTVTIRATGVDPGDPGTGLPGGLVLVLDGPAARTCAIGSGVRITVGTGTSATTGTIPPTFAPVSLGVGQHASVHASWRNWCGEQSPAVRIDFPDGSATESELGRDVPACTDPATPSVLEFTTAQLTDVQGGGQRP
ncbi:hypothetical protein [Nocardioides daeguensis]|uniref:DUF4232 domain-containing protein n=1 Tax=Nocardioides daeguensis TaxID=908359 RepID=A0ABP6VJF0_9ACTN|nr:hypothetical protein [Nocardioides daeguensis]MBV6728912.1 hypothetical protein [Nocardioides daeguensis]MCR1773433.1 hypothetical protein [Nocardioides daeguensis]